ncbi:MAG: hypothetical protein PHW07_05940 [Sulfurospirillaceae bacterium]|nr:hypothetical protein [Sulfurospirillaceae bacterium]
MHTCEIERKFVLKSPQKALSYLKKLAVHLEKQAIVQVYIKISRDMEERVRMSGDIYIWGRKFGEGLVRKEEEKIVKKSFFKKAMKKILGNPIVKTRYIFTLEQSEKYIVDIYKKPFRGFATLEVEFTSLRLASTFCLDSKIEVLYDATEDERYKNKNLALFGLPSSYDFELEDVFKKCDTIGSKKLDFVFLGGMNTHKVLRILLYREVQFFEKYAIKFAQGKKKALVKILERVQNIKEILSLSKKVFDQRIVECCFGRFLEIESYLIEKKGKRFIAFVGTKDYEELLLDLKFFLSEYGNFYLSKEGNMPILFFVKEMSKSKDSCVVKKLKSAIAKTA